jgi:methylmalonyl-CoA/ethylmalonyl-CoA epimerase
MDELKPYVTAIDHVGIAVPDLDEALGFYRDVLGFELYHEEVNEEQGVHEAMLRPPGTAPGQTVVQLLAPLGPDTTIGKFLASKGPGVQQVASRVADIDAVTDALRAKGLRVMYEKAVPGTADSRVNFVHPKDAGGVLIELVEPAPAER